MMMKSLTGIAAAVVVCIAAAPAPANAFAARHAPGVHQDQATVDQVWHRGVPHRRYYRQTYRRAYPYRAYSGRRVYARPYAYAAPYPYYGGYYAPRPFIGIGPFGLGVW